MEIQDGVLQGGPEFIGTHGGVGRPWSRITASQNDTECGRGEVSSLPSGSFLAPSGRYWGRQSFRGSTVLSVCAEWTLSFDAS